MHASPGMRPMLASQYDRKRSDYVVHASEIALWAQTYENKKNCAPGQAKNFVASAMTANATTDTRICNICSVVGHIARICPTKAKDENDDGEVR
uniref:CCHC-type domain-containing protein n=1 Tax=Peronospora matthiolae TaxID=2874970 RepID=A0AAV1U9D4_9STRA